MFSSKEIECGIIRHGNKFREVYVEARLNLYFQQWSPLKWPLLRFETILVESVTSSKKRADGFTDIGRCKQ